MHKTVKIEYLYLDLNSCDRCVGTDVILDEVVSLLQPVLELSPPSTCAHRHIILSAR